MIKVFKELCWDCLPTSEDRLGINFVLEKRARTDLLYVFCGQERRPRLVLKVARDERVSETLRREAMAIEAVREWSSNAQLSFPLVRVFEIAGRTILVFNYLEGVGCDHLKGEEELFMRLWPSVVSLCVDLRNGDSHEGVPFSTSDFWGRVFLGTSEKECEIFLRHSLGKEKGRLLWLNAQNWVKRSNGLSTGLLHGDLGYNNLFCTSKGAVMLCDWEHSPIHGPAFYDLLFFVVHWVHYRNSDALDSPLSQQTLEAVRCGIARYAKETGERIPPLDGPLALCVVLVSAFLLRDQWNIEFANSGQWLRAFETTTARIKQALDCPTFF